MRRLSPAAIPLRPRLAPDPLPEPAPPNNAVAATWLSKIEGMPSEVHEWFSAHAATIENLTAAAEQLATSAPAHTLGSVILAAAQGLAH